MANFLWLNDDIDHDNIKFIDIIYGDYITNDIIDHDYITITLGYIDIGNKSTTSSLAYAPVRPSASLLIRLPGGVRVYVG
jgi:hypothetical protein